jgi:hypothetical protein
MITWHPAWDLLTQVKCLYMVLFEPSDSQTRKLVGDYAIVHGHKASVRYTDIL